MVLKIAFNPGYELIVCDLRQVDFVVYVLIRFYEVQNTFSPFLEVKVNKNVDVLIGSVLVHDPLHIVQLLVQTELNVALLEDAPVQHRPVSHVIELVNDKLALFPHDLQLRPQTRVVYV